MKDGLSMNPVIAIAQDKKGFLWFATQDGLNRFDGYTFVVHKNKIGDSTTLSDNLLTTLFMDKTSNIWVGTLNGGIQYFDISQEKFIRYSLLKKGAVDLTPKTVWQVYEDSDGFMWIGTISGLYRLDRKSGSILSIKDIYPSFSLLSKIDVISIIETTPGILWAGSDTGLFRLNLHTGEIKLWTYQPGDTTSLSDNLVLSLFQDKDKKLWVGTADGLNLFVENEKMKTVRFTHEKESSDKIKSRTKRKYSIFDTFEPSTVRSITQTDSGTLWLATDYGLIQFNPYDFSFKRHIHELSQPNSINSDLMRSVFIDNSKNLWAGSISAGISKLDLKPKKFEHFEKRLNNPFRFTEDYVRSILEDSKGNLWIGTVLGGAIFQEAGTSYITHFLKKDFSDGTSINNNNVWAMYEDKAGYVWLGTTMGLNRFDPENRKFSYFENDPSNPFTISNNSIRCIFEDSRNNLWIGTENGLDKYDPETKKFTRFFRIINISNTLCDNFVWKVIEDNNGFMWIGTNNGLNKYDVLKDTFYTFKNIPNDTLSLSNNGIRTLYKDKRGYIWVGTQVGLNQIDPETGKNHPYYEKDGLPNNFIYCITEDSKNNLWISTNKGLCRFDPTAFKFKNYDVDDGLQDFEFNTNACCNTRSGFMFFGGPNGLNRFYPDKITENFFVPPVLITDIQLMNKPLRKKTPLTDIRELNLTYKENILFFEFSSLDFTSPTKNKYAYIMEGFNNEWIYSGNRRSVNYTNLNPGEYTFRVRATNSDGYWNPEGPSLIIIITPPFWKTNWFYLICIVTTAVFIYSYIKWRERNLKVEKRILEEKVGERTSELQQEKKKIEAINKELEKLSIVARETYNSVMIMDSQGEIEWVNEGFTRLFGYSLEEYKMVKGKTLYEVSGHTNIRELVKKCSEEKTSLIYESVNFSKDNKSYYIQSTLTPITDENGKLKKIVVIDTDITESKKNEEIIKEKNRDITDSITYAKNIQEAILPQKTFIYNSFPEAFVLFKPKDIVSGDFYWFNHVKNSQTENLPVNDFKVVAAVDCTGHGVPGAFMSMIGNDLLNQIIIENKNIDPGKILSLLNDGIHRALKQNEKAKHLRDGMDLCLCCLDTSCNELSFAGAVRPLWILRNNELIEIKGDRYSIGGFTDPGSPFTTHKVLLNPGDCVYLFSDGFADQLGGKNNKKLLTKNFKSHLISIQSVPLREQEQLLLQFFDDWKGKEVQTDDCMVIGFKV